LRKKKHEYNTNSQFISNQNKINYKNSIKNKFILQNSKLLSTLLLAFCNSTILDNTIVEFLLLLKLLKYIYNKTLLLLFLN